MIFCPHAACTPRRPDLVAVTGDLTHGWCCLPSSPGRYHGDESACFSPDEDEFDWLGAFEQAVCVVQRTVPHFCLIRLDSRRCWGCTGALISLVEIVLRGSVSYQRARASPRSRDRTLRQGHSLEPIASHPSTWMVANTKTTDAAHGGPRNTVLCHVRQPRPRHWPQAVSYTHLTLPTTSRV